MPEGLTWRSRGRKRKNMDLGLCLYLGSKSGVLGFVGSLFVGEFKTEEWDLEQEGKVGQSVVIGKIHCLCLLTRKVRLLG